MAPLGRSCAVWALAVIALAVAGCGPITATTRIAEASVAIDGAEGAEAEKYAVYEYTSAIEYLRKAKEEEGYSDFQAAIDYAVKSRAFAEQARERAMKSPARGLPAPNAAPAPARPTPPTPAAPRDGIPSGSEL